MHPSGFSTGADVPLILSLSFSAHQQAAQFGCPISLDLLDSRLVW